MTFPHTIVSFHAHPDDEALLTGGFLAAAAAAGNRVVLVVATDGAAGLSEPMSGAATSDLGVIRRAELQASARALGVARVEWLGYADSGSAPPERVSEDSRSNDARQRFVDAEPGEAAALLARILIEEQASLLTTYDPMGGYGHPDHRQVHLVGHRAALHAATPIVLEATADRTSILRALRLLRVVARVVAIPDLPAGDQIFTARADITHRLDVRPYLPQKRAALRAHVSQTTGGPRTIALLLALPRMLSDRILGTESFRATVGEPMNLSDYVTGRVATRAR